jgi:hypothetical protein
LVISEFLDVSLAEALGVLKHFAFYCGSSGSEEAVGNEIEVFKAKT